MSALALSAFGARRGLFRIPAAPLAVATVLGSLFFNSLASADQALVRTLAETNVNHQYLVESVSIGGVEVAHFQDAKLPPSLRHRLASLVGAPCDMSAIGDLAGKLRSSLHLQDVQQRLSRGSSPDRIRVDFEVVRKDYAFDLSVPRFLYDSGQGWTADLDASVRFRQHSITAGFGSNGDDLTERFTGFSTRYEDAHLGTDRVRFGVGFEDYHDLWNPSTRRAVSEIQNSINPSTPGASNELALYRSRRNIAPTLTFALSREISVTLGASFESMEMEAPPVPGADTAMSANSATGEVDFGYTKEGRDVTQRWDAKYGVRVGTRELGSDYSYTRQNVSVRYEWRSGRHTVTDRLTAGTIHGQAPMFERFILGNSSTLQGWDRYAIDPVGGDRMAHNSVSYGHQYGQRTAEVFYDAGLVGNGDHMGTLRHSAGVGFRQGIFNLAMAFPLFDGRFAAIVMAGMNY